MTFVAAGLMVFGALAFLVAKFGTRFLKRMLGMDIATDIIVTVFLVWLFATTATISGMLIGLFVGLLVSGFLFLGKKLLPHQKLVKVDGRYIWVDQAGEWVCQTKKWFR